MPSAGDYVRASDTTRYYCRASQATIQTGIVTATFTDVTFDRSDDVDNLGIHDPVTNNNQFTIGLKLGWWLVHGNVAWTTATISKRYGAQVALNGTAVSGSQTFQQASVADAINSVTFTFVQSTVSTDYVTIQMRQDTGANTTTSVSGYRSSAHLLYLGA